MAFSTIYGYDSFKAGTSIADLTLGHRWNTILTSSQFTLQSVKGRFGGQSLQWVSTTSTGNLNKVLAAAHATLVLNFPLRVDSMISGTLRSLVQFLDGSTVQISLKLNADGTFSILRGGSAGTVLATSSFAINTSIYYVMELKVTFAAGTGGTIELRCIGPGSNGANSAIIGPTGSLNTSASGNAQATGYRIGDDIGSGGAITVQYEHIACIDDFVGDKRFYSRLPNADSSVIWTPNASTNISRVQEAQEDGDTTYNSSSTPGQIDLFAWPATITGLQGVLAVITSIWARKDDAGTRQVRTTIKQGGTVANGATVNLATTYVEQADIAYVDPVSGIAFVKSDVDSLLAGYEEVA